MFVHKNDDETTTVDELNSSDGTDVQQTDSVTDTADETAETDPAPLAGDDTESADSTDAGSENAGQTAAGDSANEDGTDGEIDSNADTFSRAYVEKLRKESAGYRERAQRADDLAARLHTALVAATGRMADPTDLAFDAAHLDDADALTNSIDELLTRKPHLATRTPFGDVGQGNRGGASEPVNLADILRARA